MLTKSKVAKALFNQSNSGERALFNASDSGGRERVQKVGCLLEEMGTYELMRYSHGKLPVILERDRSIFMGYFIIVQHTVRCCRTV